MTLQWPALQVSYKAPHQQHESGSALPCSVSPDRSLLCRSGDSLSSAQGPPSCSQTCPNYPRAQDASLDHQHKRSRRVPRSGSAIELGSMAYGPAHAPGRSVGQLRMCNSAQAGLWRTTRDTTECAQLGTSLFLAHAISEGPSCPHQRQAVCSVQFHSSSDLLLTARAKKALHLHRVTHSGGDLSLRRVAAHDTPAKLACAQWCPWLHDGVLTGDVDGVVGLVATATGELLAEIDEHGGHRVRCVRASCARVGLIASAADDGVVKLWGGRHLESAAGTLQASRAHGRPLGLAWLGSQEEQLVTTSDTGTACLWDVRSAASPVCSWQAHARACALVGAAASGSVATAAVNGCVRIWRSVGAAGGADLSAEYAVADADSDLSSLAMRQDGALAATALHGGVHVCGTSRGVLVLQTMTSAGVQATSAGWGTGSGGAHLLAIGGSDGRTRVMHIAA